MYVEIKCKLNKIKRKGIKIKMKQCPWMPCHFQKTRINDDKIMEYCRLTEMPRIKDFQWLSIYILLFLFSSLTHLRINYKNYYYFSVLINISISILQLPPMEINEADVGKNKGCVYLARDSRIHAFHKVSFCWFGYFWWMFIGFVCCCLSPPPCPPNCIK